MAHLLTEHGVICAEEFINGVAINPYNGPKDWTDFHRREEEEVILWLNRPFVTGTGPFQVMCLNGNTVGRATRWELTDNIKEAVSFAILPQPKRRP